MIKQQKKRASVSDYVSPNQLTLEGFKTPFEQSLNSKNRWVVLANKIPWDEINNFYFKHIGGSNTGRPPINPRIVIGVGSKNSFFSLLIQKKKPHNPIANFPEVSQYYNSFLNHHI